MVDRAELHSTPRYSSRMYRVASASRTPLWPRYKVRSAQKPRKPGNAQRCVLTLNPPAYFFHLCKPSFFIAWSKTEALVFHGPVVDADQEPSETREVQLQLRRPAACSQAKLPLQDRRSQVCMTWVGTFTVLHVVTSSDYLAL